ncbi:MAG: hypothetical protein WCF93_05125 [Candidatus Moraniibacteriota bacterium]
MEKYSFMHAHNEAFELQRKALKKKGQDEDLGDLSKEDYKNEEKLISKEMLEYADKFALELKNGRISSAMRIKLIYKLPDEIVQPIAIDVFVNRLDIGNVEAATKVKDSFKLPNEFVHGAVIEQIIVEIKNNCISSAVRIRDAFDLPTELLGLALINQIASKLKDEQLDSALNIKKFFKISNEDMRQVAEEQFIDKLEKFNINLAVDIRNNFELSSEFVSAEARKQLTNKLSENRIDAAKNIKKVFDLSDEDLLSAAKECFIIKMKEHRTDLAVKIKDNFKLSEELVLLLVKEQFFEDFKNGDDRNALATKKTFKLSNEILKDDRFVSSLIIRIIKDLESGHIRDVVEIKKTFEFTDSILKDDRVVSATLARMIASLNSGNIRDASFAKQALAPPAEIFKNSVIQNLAKEKFIERLKEKSGYFNSNLADAMEIKSTFDLSDDILQDEEVQLEAKQQFIDGIAGCSFKKALELKNAFGLADDFVEPVVKQGYIDQLRDSNIENVQNLQDSFDIQVNYEYLCEEFPGVVAIIETLEAQNLGSGFNFRDKNIFILFIKFNDKPEELFRRIKQNPFLLEALKENKQHGLKLLSKFQEFDNIAQQNIQKLYEIKAKIKNQHPSLDPNSCEFRMLMQKNLIGFENNKKILVEIGKSGVDIKQWLTYSAEKEFDLGKKDDTLFSEQIQSPIKRIDESIGSYLSKANSVLAFYKKDLTESETPSEKKTELFEKLEKMQAQVADAQQNGDNEKIKGIQKGIINLEKQLEQVKPTTVWNKLIGDMNNLKILSTDLSKLYQDLCNLEKEQENAEVDQKKQIDLKVRIKQQELKIKNKIADLDESLSGFQVITNDLLGKTFGRDRSDSIMQEINMSVGMDFDHYREDLSTIQNLFKDSSNSLEKTPMRIAIAPRNPDADLYLGNDCPCCIRIDSDFHGAESPIADYVTDLGMHNIVVYDEKRKKPVAVAWCFVGKNGSSEKPILVIDNIEADTNYSVPFSSQLERELSCQII